MRYFVMHDECICITHMHNEVPHPTHAENMENYLTQNTLHCENRYGEILVRKKQSNRHDNKII